MAQATWSFVESLGIPDSVMRSFLFQLAELMDADPEGDQLALASGAYLTLTKDFREQFTLKSPLQQQIEYLRLQHDLTDMIGVAPRDIPGEQFTLVPQPDSPKELALELGHRDNGRAVRAALRAGFPEHLTGQRWEPLTATQVNYVRAHVRGRK
jgi:hypothetical protein